MQTFILIALTIVTFILLMQLSAVLSARKVQGRPSPNTSQIDGEASGFGRRVYYFFGRNCGPCKAMSPTIKKVREDSPNLIEVDVAQHLDLAREFGVKATPTFMMVEDGVIRKVKLGGLRESQLRALLNPPA